jgi:hypothetical protein
VSALGVRHLIKTLASPPPANRTIPWELSTIDGNAGGALRVAPRFVAFRRYAEWDREQQRAAVVFDLKTSA